MSESVIGGVSLGRSAEVDFLGRRDESAAFWRGCRLKPVDRMIGKVLAAVLIVGKFRLVLAQ